MDAILEPLLNSPRLFQYLEQIQVVAKAERERRERFYDEITPEAKWEFINGEVIMHSPATARHIRARELIARLLGVFVDRRQLGWTGGEKALVVCTRNDYEPDQVFFLPEKSQKVQPETLKFPVPDFVVEIVSESTEKRDRGVKFTDYAAHGVGEYWIVDPEAETIEQYLLGSNRAYTLAIKAAEGALHSRVIQDFVFPVRAAFDGEENLRAVKAILA